MSRNPDWCKRARFSICILGIALSTSACAETAGLFEIPNQKSISEFWGNSGLYSYHFQTDKGFNNRNLGWGLEYRYSNINSVTVGGFYNSVRHNSRYAGWYWQPLRLDAMRLGIVFGGLDGYPQMHGGSWFLAAIPVASIEYERVGMNLFVLPNYKDRVYGLLSFQMKLKLN